MEFGSRESKSADKLTVLDERMVPDPKLDTLDNSTVKIDCAGLLLAAHETVRELMLTTSHVLGLVEGAAAKVDVDSNPDQGLELPETTARALAKYGVLMLNPPMVAVKRTVLELNSVPVNVLEVLI